MIKTILLDLDGPLLDGKLRHYQCYSDILAANGFTPMPMNIYWDMKRLRRSRRELLAVSGAESIYDVFLNEWLNHIEKPEYLALDRVQNSALSKLQTWVGDGIKVVLVTMRSSRNHLMHQLQSIGLLPYLTLVVVCNQTKSGIGKALAIRQEFPDIEPSFSLWIGDTEADMEGARYLGCPVCLLANGLRTLDYLISLKPNYLGESLSDIDLEKW